MVAAWIRLDHRFEADGVLVVRVGDTGAEASSEAVTMVGEKLTTLRFGKHRATPAAIQGVAALPTDRIGRDIAAAPLPVELFFEHELTIGSNRPDADVGIAGALPAGIDVGEDVEEVHAVVSATKA